MGQPKLWLAYDPENTFLAHIVQLYRQNGIDEVVVVINADFCGREWSGHTDGIRHLADVVENPAPDLGRMHSIQLGLRKLEADHVFIHDVDRPYISPKLIHELKKQTTDCEVTVPVYKGRKGHPVVIGPKVKKLILDDHLKFGSLKTALSTFDKRLVNTDERGILVNINTDNEYRKMKGGHIS